MLRAVFSYSPWPIGCIEHHLMSSELNRLTGCQQLSWIYNVVDVSYLAC